jgi:TolB-like protein
MQSPYKITGLVMEKTKTTILNGTWIHTLCQMISFIVLVLCLLAMSGCNYRYQNAPAYMPINLGTAKNYGPGTFKTSYIADQIDYYYRGASTGPIGVTTIANLNDLHATSTFGRVFAEQLISELVMRGYEVVELRHTDALQFIGNNGEFALSRDLGAVRNNRQLAAVLAGTYVDSPQTVYVNVRLIDPASSMILSTGSVELGKSYEMAKLLRGGSATMNLERIPVKHLAQQQLPLSIFQAKYVASEDEDMGAPIKSTPIAPKMVDSWDVSKSSDKSQKLEVGKSSSGQGAFDSDIGLK